MKMSKTVISICIPVLNEQDNIGPAYKRVKETFEKLDEYDFEIVFTDNASTDQTYAEIEKIADRDPRIRVASFSRNQGYQMSILTGYLLARGEAAIQLDCDMQDPPEMIGDFLANWRNGNDVVYGIRKRRQESWTLGVARRIFYRMLNFISEENLPPDAGDFRLVDKKIIDILRQIDDQNPYLRGTIAKLGFRQIGIEYDRAQRLRGESKFNFRKLMSLSIDAVVGNSSFPLKFASYLGVFIGLFALVLSLRYLGGKLLFGQEWPSGFTTLAVLTLFNISITSTLFGVFGAYMIRVSAQVKSLPISVIERGIRIGEIKQPAKAVIIDASEKQTL